MKSTFFFLLLAAVGSSLYHVGQKSLHDVSANPMLLLSLYYVSALVLCLAAMPFFGKTDFSSMGSLAADWRLWLVALGILCIELGFLLAYQSGGSAQWSGVVVNGTAALLLVPLSLILFQESFSWNKIIGIALTLTGIYFVVKK